MIENKLGKKTLLLLLLLLALWLLVDDESTSISPNDVNKGNEIYRKYHHLAVWTAFRRHPPCFRIFRALLEFNLMLWGLAVSLWLWKNTVGEKMTGYLLFQPVDHDESKIRGVYFTESALGRYRPLNQQHQDDHDSSEDEERSFPSKNEGESDGELLPTAKNTVQEESNQQPNAVHELYETKPGGTEIDDNNNSIFEDQLSNESDPTRFELINPPCPMNVTYAALDSLTFILVTLFLFTLSSAEGGRYVDGMESVQTFRFVASVAAPVFPLVLFFVFCLALIVPLHKRKSQWKILGYTIGAPLYHVTFRDGFIGDILTSSVRPLQDIAFTTFYLLSGLQGWWQQSYDLDAADLPLESNWVLHTMILPMCMMSPLWYRFCQNLRQTYEYKSRWPYLGNALKYFIAAEVGIFGVYMRSPGHSTLWLAGFVAATLYQIWWDVFMDWNLLYVSSWKTLNLKVFDRPVNLSIPTSFRLRKTRIYSVSWLYWGIFGTNIVLRFCWTLSFLPPHYLNRAGVLSETFEGDLTAYLNPIIASGEIVRRTMWGWLRVEWEAIKVARTEPRLRGTWTDLGKEDEPDSNDLNPDSSIEFQIMNVNNALPEKPEPLETITSSPSFSNTIWRPKKIYEMSETQIIGELCIYATIFTGLGLLAAAHRHTF